MPNKEELMNAYAAALTDYAKNSPFTLFNNPNEVGKTVKGRLTKFRGEFYVKTPTQFYLVENSVKVQEMLEKDQNIEINYKPNQTKLNNKTITAKIIK